MALEVVILAAGKGSRMHSDLPKVLHKVAGMPMLGHVLNTAISLKPEAVHVVVGHGAALVNAYLDKFDNKGIKVDCVEQTEQLGTAHAVKQALPLLNPNNNVIVLYGDTPLTPANILLKLVEKLGNSPLAVLSAITKNPFGYGRIVRNESGSLLKIVEEKDADNSIRSICEINTGIIAAKAQTFLDYLPKIQNNNVQKEFYLTDLAGLLAQEGKKVIVETAEDFELLSGINSKKQLAFVERLFQKRSALRLMDEGVSFADPDRFDLRGTLEHGKDDFIDINVIIEGHVVLGNNVTLGAGCVIRDCTIADGAVISPYTVMEESSLGEETTVGPFSRLRPGSKLDKLAHVGNFVEIKKSHLSEGTKAGHLTYLGDAEIGKEVNIGAGTITCNYDGANKFKTIIGDDVFVGSDSQLVAPVNIPAGVTIAAGTTVTHRSDLKPQCLVLTRAETIVKENYKRPHKNKPEK